MGVPAGRFPALFRLLLLQCYVDRSTGASHLLGFSHYENVLQVVVQQGTCLFSVHICHWPTASTNLFCFVFSFFSIFIHSWMVMTGAMKKRTTLTHTWNKSPHRVTSTALDSEAEQTVTDTSR